MKKNLLSFFISISIVHLAQAQWSTSGANIYNTDAGSSNNLLAKFNVYQSTSLGSAVGNNLLLSTIAGNTGGPNSFQNNIWMVRTSTGSNWVSAVIHDGISVDASFRTPHTDTKTWWERDPQNDIQTWGNGNLTYLTIKQGKVGIGIASPQNMLDVNGTIHGKQINVDLNGWSDFVFKPDYHLSTLQEVKQYIDRNQHLPGIPSEKDMIDKGLDVAEMNKLLMQKVEELTLYLIEKDKQSIQQQKQIRDLSKDNNELHLQLSDLIKQMQLIKTLLEKKQ